MAAGQFKGKGICWGRDLKSELKVLVDLQFWKHNISVSSIHSKIIMAGDVVLLHSYCTGP